ncbi:hypothetical protein AAE478_001273 [Parahypoxylon ruwenzoriense]
MTRKLPWKRAERSLPSTPKPARPTPLRQQQVKHRDSEIDGPSAKPNSEKSASNQTDRPGSTSPPPEPLLESFMVDGLEHDDQFRMVEDEFLSTAQKFTAHLHAAEYHRLKAASKLQNADTIRNISRPVVGRMTDLVKKRQERKSRFEKQRLANRKARANRGLGADHADSEDDSWRPTSLYGLMESPSKRVTRLDNLTTTVAATRAAAGFDGSKPRLLFATSHPKSDTSRLPGSKPTAKQILSEANETESDGEDDLDIRTPKFHAKPVSNAQPFPPRSPKRTLVQRTNRDNHLLYASLESQRPTKQAIESKAADEGGESSGDSGDDLLSHLKRRQEDRKRIREQRKLAASKAQSKQAAAAAASAEDIIPGFL